MTIECDGRQLAPLENEAKVKDLVLQDRRLTIQDLCNTLGLSYGTCQRILSEELNMRRIAEKSVPRLLQNELSFPGTPLQLKRAQ
jgi:hypothetical protein